MKLETLKTIVFDIKNSVFDNDTEAIMYVTKDIYADRFIISIPVLALAFDIPMDAPDREHDWLLKVNLGIGGDWERTEKLKNAIKAAIAEFE